MTQVLNLGDKNGGGIDRNGRNGKRRSFGEKMCFVQNSLHLMCWENLLESGSPELQDFLKPPPLPT